MGRKPAARAAGQRLLEAPSEIYQRLLALFPQTRVGWGREPRFPGTSMQPMTYALVALAEARVSDGMLPERGIRAVRWLLRNADLDRDSRPGWGIPHEWDAFNDGVGAAGATNPRHHPYTTTTALVLQSLADAVSSGWLSAAERSVAVSLSSDVCRRWIRDAVSMTAGGGAFFWYSPHIADAKDCPNASALMVGAIRRARVAGLLDGIAPAADAVIDEAVRHLVATSRRDAPRFPAWQYIEGAVPGRPNDAVHHAYTVWGLETYRESFGDVPLPWSTAAAGASCRMFFRDGAFTEDPPHATTEGVRPARLWGAGMCLAVVSRYGSRAAARAMAAALLDAYRSPRGLKLVPNAGSDTLYRRHAAHVLLGFAELVRRDRLEAAEAGGSAQEPR